MHWYYTYYLYNIVWLKYTFFLLSYYFLFIFNFDHFYFLLKVFNIYFYLKNKHFFSMKSTESNLEHRKNVAHVDQCQLSRSGTPKENSLRNPNCYLIFVFFREWEPCWLVHVKLELPFVVPPFLPPILTSLVIPLQSSKFKPSLNSFETQNDTLNLLPK